jgi:hypothetical protein
MAQLNGGEYDKAVGYNYERFSPEGYKNLVANHERVYHERQGYWRKLLTDEILLLAQSAAKVGLPLVTTECWAIVDFKDWPLLKWDIIKELCELGVITAAATGQWAAIATSNFCGPQFTGMWCDVEWHRKLTGIIKSSPVHAELMNTKLIQRL